MNEHVTLGMMVQTAVVQSKLLRTIKSFLLLFLLSSQVFASALASQSVNVKITLNNPTVGNVVEELHQQTGYEFSYDADILSEKLSDVSVNVKNERIENVLSHIFGRSDVSFKVINNRVLLKNNKKGNNNISSPEDNKQQLVTRVISGVINDDKGEPVIGATIVEKGNASNGTVTDIDGTFVLNVAPDAILEISYVGYESQDIITAGRNTFSIVLHENTKILNEIVVVGYGTQKKVNLTGAVQMVDSEILNDRPLVNAAKGLQGAIPNLNISFKTGDPTSETKFNIRGATSLNGGSALVLVDGVETDLNLINPQDIESVSVLKDAASAAVYGPRGSFGVILVTTKRGKLNQKLQINYNNSFAWSSPSRLPKGMASDKWLESINQANINNGGGAYFSAEQIEATKKFIADPVNNPSAFLDTTGKFTSRGQWGYAGNTDWYKEFYNDAAFMQQHNASLSGGSEKSTYYGSVGYKGQDGLFRFGQDKYKRFNIAFNFTTQVNDWLQLNFNTKLNNSDKNVPTNNFGMGSPYYEVYRMFPHIPIYLPNGTDFAALQGDNFNYNIAGRMALAGRTTTADKDFWYTGGFNITPIKGLSIKGDYTQNYWFSTYREHKKTIYQVQPDVNTPPVAVNTPNGVWQYRSGDVYRAMNLWAEYDFNLAKSHNFKLMTGYNDERKDYNNLEIESQDLFVNELTNGGLADKFINIKEPGDSWAVKGIFYRLNYDYMGKYLLEANGRYDGSSKYPVGKQWGFFPSVSAGWRVSEEGFYEPLRATLEYLKLRASYGDLGNQVVDNNFQYLGTLSPGTYNYVINNAILKGINPSTLASTNITWERVNTINAGLDFATLNNRLSGSFDYYVRRTRDMVVSKAYPAVLGTSGGKENLADMRTNGWELMLTWNDKISDVGGSTLTYSVGMGISDAFSEITKYNNPTRSLADHYEGKRLGEIWGYVTDGFIADEAEATKMVDTQSHFSRTWLPGDIRYKNLDNDPKINPGKNTVDEPGDRKIIGNSTPRYRYSINANVGWKGLDLRAMFEGVGKRDVWFGESQFWGYSGIWWAAITDYHVDNAWSKTNTDAYFPVPTFSGRSRQVQTKYLQNGAYIRLRDVTLSYTLPTSIPEKLNISQVRVFASGQNLWEATKMFKYLEPDVSGFDKNDGSPQFEDQGKGYPFSRTFSFGFNVTF